MKYMSTPPRPTDRATLLVGLAQPRVYDLAIIGGGASGLGIALDAAARGLSVLLLESHDFAKGTSSRSTKLVHGGVRYLAQGRLSLVRDALRERRTLLQNAPHLAQPLPFVMPAYNCWEKPVYGAGLKFYGALSGAHALGPTEFLSRSQAINCLPNVRQHKLQGGVKYWDGQFDDARLALALARTAASRGALLLNYCAVTDLVHDRGRVIGLHCQDVETGMRYTVKAGCVINATGVWVDEFRRKDGALLGQTLDSVVAPSQGVHLVVDRSFMPSDCALLIPHTRDGRVLFALPWLGALILGTSDTPRLDLPREPLALRGEVAFILAEVGRYLEQGPSAADVKSVWVGLRPLVKQPNEAGRNTQDLSREHAVLVSASGLVSVTGGKWTSYRSMANHVLERCVQESLLKRTQVSPTRALKLVGAVGVMPQVDLRRAQGLHSYGDEQHWVASMPGAERDLGAGLSEAMVRFAARFEYARRTEDVLARRSRLLFLDAALAEKLAQQVGEILQQETGIDPQTQAFSALTKNYLLSPEHFS